MCGKFDKLLHACHINQRNFYSKFDQRFKDCPFHPFSSSSLNFRSVKDAYKSFSFIDNDKTRMKVHAIFEVLTRKKCSAKYYRLKIHIKWERIYDSNVLLLHGPKLYNKLMVNLFISLKIFKNRVFNFKNPFKNFPCTICIMIFHFRLLV